MCSKVSTYSHMSSLSYKMMWSLPLYTTVVAQITASRKNTSGMLELTHVLYCFGTDYDLVQLCRGTCASVDTNTYLETSGTILIAGHIHMYTFK